MESSQGCGGKRFLSFLRWGGFLGCGDRGSQDRDLRNFMDFFLKLVNFGCVGC